MRTPYKIESGEPTAKWKASAQAGAAALPVNLVLAYLIAQFLPDVPGEVRAALVLVLVAALSWLTTQGATMLAGWLKRPDPSDRPVIDRAAMPPPVEPLPNPPPGID